jgi:hypothetical protein
MSGWEVNGRRLGSNQTCQQGDCDAIGITSASRREPDPFAATFQQVIRNEVVDLSNELRA